MLLDLHTPGSGARCQSEYVRDLQTCLKATYKVAHEAIVKSANRAKKHYDIRVRGSVPEIGDLVLVKLVGLTGKHKLADKWETEPYRIIGKPDASMPVYVVQRSDGVGKERTLHRNMLFPLALPLSNGSQDQDQDVSVDDNSCSDESASLTDDTSHVRQRSQQGVNEDSSSDSEDDFHTVPREDPMPPVPADVDDSIPADMATLGVPLEAPP